MTRYTQKSKIKEVKIRRNNTEEIVFAEIIKDPDVKIGEVAKDIALKEIKGLVAEAWGEYNSEYIRKGCIQSYLLCIVRNKEGDLIGIAPIRKHKIFGRDIYTFGLSATTPKYQNCGVLKTMDYILGRKVLIENAIKGKFKVEFVFITPNIRTLGAIARVADFIYPNPYMIDPKNHKIEKADAETWRTVKKFLQEEGELYRSLDREGNIMEGFYDDKPQLLFSKKITHSDKRVNDFGEYYVYKNKGRDVVVRAILNIWKVFTAKKEIPNGL
ncbi:MAG: hypothetical protein WCI63_00290 [bacterium]